MLKRHYQRVYIGKSYLSLIKSIRAQKSGKDVLLIDDKNVGYGKNWLANVGELEKQLIKRTLRDIELHDLADSFDKYLNLVNLEFYFNEVRLRLNNNPYMNLLELCRKIPQLYDDSILKVLSNIDVETFNGRCQAFVSTAAKQVTFKALQEYRKLLETIAPELHTILNSLKEKLQEPTQDYKFLSFKRQFLFTLQSCYQNSFGRIFSEIEVDYLLLQVVMPFYHIDFDSFDKELMKHFLSMGGNIKQTTVQQWQTHQNKLVNILLSSYEGVITPEVAHFMGEGRESLPFKVGKQAVLFKSLKLNLQFKQPFFKGKATTDILVCRQDRLGTSYPVNYISFHSEFECDFYFTYRFEQGSLPDHYIERARSEMIEFFARHFPNLREEDIFVNSHYQAGSYIWVEHPAQHEAKQISITKEHFHFNSVQVYEREARKALQGVKYQGPLDGRPLGVISYLI
jgi:hypothetical protein